jgi:hypothetical protein
MLETTAATTAQRVAVRLFINVDPVVPFDVLAVVSRSETLGTPG